MLNPTRSQQRHTLGASNQKSFSICSMTIRAIMFQRKRVYFKIISFWVCFTKKIIVKFGCRGTLYQNCYMEGGYIAPVSTANLIHTMLRFLTSWKLSSIHDIVLLWNSSNGASNNRWGRLSSNLTGARGRSPRHAQFHNVPRVCRY